MSSNPGVSSHMRRWDVNMGCRPPDNMGYWVSSLFLPPNRHKMFTLQWSLRAWLISSSVDHSCEYEFPWYPMISISSRNWEWTCFQKVCDSLLLGTQIYTKVPRSIEILFEGGYTRILLTWTIPLLSLCPQTWVSTQQGDWHTYVTCCTDRLLWNPHLR
jgi:hypothetical protein